MEQKTRNGHQDVGDRFAVEAADAVILGQEAGAPYESNAGDKEENGNHAREKIGIETRRFLAE